MQLIVIDDIGMQKLLSLPSGEEIKLEANLDNTTISDSRKERIARALKAQGRGIEIKTDEFKNYIEEKYFYLTVSGSEYLKMDLQEFWQFVNVCNALSMIDVIDIFANCKKIRDEKDQEEYNLFNNCGNTRFSIVICSITKEQSINFKR